MKDWRARWVVAMFLLLAVFLVALQYANGMTLRPGEGLLMAAVGLACFIAAIGAVITILQPYIARK